MTVAAKRLLTALPVNEVNMTGKTPSRARVARRRWSWPEWVRSTLRAFARSLAPFLGPM